MGDRMIRFFPNEMPDFVEEKEEDIAATVGPEDDSLMKLLSMPYSALSERLKQAALDLKDTVAVETWGLGGQLVRDFSLYCGTLGTALLQFKAYQLTNNIDDLNLCSEIIKACDTVCSRSRFSHSRDGTFLCGGTWNIKMPKDLPDELLAGRAGFLWACLFINKHIGEGTIPSKDIGALAKDILLRGRRLGVITRCPLMFENGGEKYWGAAHGLAGIMHVLMHVKLNPDEAEEVKCTLKYLIKNQFPSGNFPSAEEDNEDYLVHWCHGAPGISLTFLKAAEVFGDEEFLEAAVNAAEVIWNRGLLRRVGICHGVSGNAYVFLSLYRVTGNKEFLYRAKAFACFLFDRAHRLIAEGEMHGGDNPYSLFEGIGGMAYLLLDMTKPTDAKFPGYEL
ncbi:hypothetical protein Vadar_009813 [Vaccinium darrowii]|uniref:Uncharacterized protein n=1 Tax=Vaccinium darrowii TaxID=229202 RepID=A0ACB7Z3E4_9ERIC|nr:hypothetical protein Vadar_009813 [Vaccinium darrowii]